MKHLFAKLCVVVCLLLSATTSYAQTKDELIKTISIHSENSKKCIYEGKYQSAIDSATIVVDILERNERVDVELYAEASITIAVGCQKLGRYAESIKYYKKALELSIKNSGIKHEDVALLLNNIGVCSNELGDYTEAIEYLQQALDIRKELFNDIHPDIATSLNNLGSCYIDIGDYTKAMEYLQQALAIYKKLFGDEHPDIAMSLNNLGFCYINMGDYTKAMEYYQQSLAIYKKLFGDEHPNIATSLNNLGSCYSNMGDYAKAIEFCTQALAIKKQALGENHPEYARSLSNLATYYSNIGDYAKAIEFGTQALAILKQALGENHPDYATSLNNLGSCYSNIGDYTKAMEYYQQALAILKKLFGDEHPDIATSLNDLGLCYRNIGDYTKVMEYYQQTLAIYKKLFGDEHPNIATSLNNLGDSYSNMGDYAKAIELNTQALKIRRMVLGENHPDYATSLSNLATDYSNMGDYAKAIEFCTQALAIKKQALGENHPDYALSLSNLATDYSNMGDYAKAIEFCTQALAIKKQALGENHPDYARSLSNLATYYSEIGDYAKAIEFGTQALAILKQALGENHPDYATSLNNLGSCYSNIGDYTKAMEYYQQALRIFRKTVGDDHSTYAQALANMGVWYHKLGNTKKLLPIWNKHFDIDKRYILSQFRSMTEYQRKTLWSKTSMQIITTNHTYAPLGKTFPDACKTSYNSLLFAKGLILSSSIEFDRVINESGNKELLKTFEELRTTQRILNTLYNKPIAERPAGETERLEARANELEKVLIAGSKEYADFTRNLSVEWEDVRNALADKDVAIEFIAGTQLLDNTTKPYYAALVLRKGWDSPKYVELMTEEELTEHYKRGAHIYSGYGALELYNRIWAKLEPYLSEGDNVYFAPDGLLHQMNVELFYDVNRKRANEKYNLYRVSSTREVCLDRATIKKSSAVLYGGLQYNMSNDSLIMESKRYRGTPTMVRFRADSLQRAGWEPLPGTKREVDSIDVVCKARNVKSDIYTSTVGNEESFKALSGKKTPIIHIATHGFFFKNEEREKRNNHFFERMSIDQQGTRKPDNSMKRSGLIFAGGQRAWLGESIPEGVEDGILLAEEISTMDLSGTDIVVLSACQTGLGEITSDGVFGLQRAFKKAGVKTIIMSLWSVEDAATSLFMRTFYREWLEGKSKRDAFATAQAVTRAYNNDASSWAAFVMLDDYQK